MLITSRSSRVNAITLRDEKKRNVLGFNVVDV